MPLVNLLGSLPQTKRNIKRRAAKKDPEVIALSKKYDEDYFDGNRKYGYGGYYYDGRWRPVAQDIVNYYQLQQGASILDIGCAKGFLMQDLLALGYDVKGVDISSYAIRCADKVLDGRLYWASADLLPFDDKAFDLVLSINTIHNLPREGAKKALQEIMRVSKTGKAFVQVDSYFTKEQKALFEDWVLTAEFHDYPSGWLELFQEAGYEGDYNWTIV